MTDQTVSDDVTVLRITKCNE